MSISLSSVVAQAPDCLAADVQDEVVLMSVESGQYVALDAIGKDIWTRIASPRRVDALCADLEGGYAAPRATIEADVLSFLTTLSDAGTLKVSE